MECDLREDFSDLPAKPARRSGPTSTNTGSKPFGARHPLLLLSVVAALDFRFAMNRAFRATLLLLFPIVLLGQEASDDQVPVVGESSPAVSAEPQLKKELPGDGKVTIYVIPIRDQIAKPALYVVRKGVKEAVDKGADVVVLDMQTPGGELGVTLEIMGILDRFDGITATYVNTEALSAGAFISAATDRIYFAPQGVIGAAAPVSSTGEDIQKTMHQKIISYLRAKVRAITDEHPFRAEVISAMMDADYELKIGEEIIKPKGELLSLTANEAMKEYGDPPQPLLGAGIVDSLSDLYKTLAGPNDFEVREFAVTWSIKLAQWLTMMSPLLLGLGGMLLFAEFKTPGFGIFGISGIVLLLLVFFGHHLAGLSGQEPALVFILGVALVFIELLFFPGVLVFGIAGIVLMLGSLLWGMADIWPDEGFGITPDTFAQPVMNLGMGFALAILFAVLLARFLPKSVFWNRMVLASAVMGSATRGTIEEEGASAGSAPVVGDIAVVVSDLHPGGRIEFNGRRFEARADVGEILAGQRVRIIRRADFVYEVEPVK